MSGDARSITVSINSKYSGKFLEELSNAELIETVRDLQDDSRHFELENLIFENFLRANEPALIAGMKITLAVAQKMHQKALNMRASSALEKVPSITTVSTAPVSISSKTSVIHSDGRSAASSDHKKSTGQSSTTSVKGPRINISQKTDLVMREIEEMQNILEHFIHRTHKQQCRLRAEIEESKIRAQEVNECKSSFQQEVVIEGAHKMTQKIPAEKFVRYMQEWLKSAQFMLEKLRLRTSSLRIQQSKLKNLLAQKEELGECVHEVDFEKLKIENKNFQIKIELKNHHLLELKQINGRANLMLIRHKKILDKKGDMLGSLRKNMKIVQKKIVELEEETTVTQQEVKNEKERYRHIRKIAQLYRVPGVIDYIHKKAELSELYKTLKTWRRKSNIQRISLSTYTKMMMHITNARKPRKTWFNPHKSDNWLMQEYDLSSHSTKSSAESEASFCK